MFAWEIAMGKISDVLTRKGKVVHTVDRETTVFDAIKKMVDNNLGSVIVTDADSICASCVPALIKTIVAGNMPSWLTRKKVIVRIGVKPMTRLMIKNGNTGTRRRVNR